MTGHPWLPPTGETITIVIAFLVAVVVIVLLARGTASRTDPGSSLRDQLDSDMEILESVWRLARREIVMGHPRPDELKRQALAFRANLDDDLTRIEEFFRTSVADSPVPASGLSGTLVDEGLSLRFSALVTATRYLLRSLDRCEDVDSGVARLRAAVTEVLGRSALPLGLETAEEPQG